MTPICPWDCLITRRSEVQVLPPQPYWVAKIDTLTWNPWEIRGFSVFMPCFFKACFIDTQGHFRASGRTWTKFSVDLACFMVGSTLSDTFYCSSFLKNLKLFIEEAGILFDTNLFSVYSENTNKVHMQLSTPNISQHLYEDRKCSGFWKEYCFFLPKAL